jgi:CheY-like chemotaxis protein
MQNGETKKRILLVDDDRELLWLLVNVLDTKGVEVDVATTGLQAMRRAKENRPDLILLDIMLPDISGYEVCELFKKDPALRDIPVMVVTALNNFAEKERALELGAADFMGKPFDQGWLLWKIEQFLGQPAAA